MKVLIVELSDPYMKITEHGICFWVDLVVNYDTKEEKHLHYSYKSADDVMEIAEKHKEEILGGAAEIDAWLAAKGI